MFTQVRGGFGGDIEAASVVAVTHEWTYAYTLVAIGGAVPSHMVGGLVSDRGESDESMEGF
jgi:hypothetical protein